MAQPQHAKEHLADGAEFEYPIKNTLYDLVTVMSHCGKSIEVLDEYLKDARAANDHEVVDLFEKIRDSEINNCRMSKDLLDRMVKAGEVLSTSASIASATPSLSLSATTA